MYVFFCVYVPNFLSPAAGLFRACLVERGKEGYGEKRVEQCGTDMYVAIF